MMFKVNIEDVQKAAGQLKSFSNDSAETLSTVSQANDDFVSAGGGEYISASSDAFSSLEATADSFLSSVDEVQKDMDKAHGELSDNVEKKREQLMDAAKAPGNYSKNVLEYQDSTVVSDCIDADTAFQNCLSLVDQACAWLGCLDNGGGERGRISQNLEQLKRNLNSQKTQNDHVSSSWMAYQSAVSDFEGTYSAKFNKKPDGMADLLDLASKVLNGGGDLTTAIRDPDKILEEIADGTLGNSLKDGFKEFFGSDFWIHAGQKVAKHAKGGSLHFYYTEFGDDLADIGSAIKGPGRHAADITAADRLKSVSGGFHAVGKAVGWLSAVFSVADIANSGYQAYEHTPGSEQARRKAVGTAVAKGTASTAMNIAGSAVGQSAGEAIGFALVAATPLAPFAPVAAVACGVAGAYLGGKISDKFSQMFGWKN
ncbi:hypothetical protein OZX74_06745 [Bifidobacterium sp. ESL0798]|uniref:hypothetical protein n=1 Tax=Bifidobacterium sp. ESL0798 TaxID=2983235 RepID=UPI0023F622F4|nr:hypothetical protein [Bifidobacterium sp. ESL0798]WEV73609.1 hypothetical protein OZX74_06745 [Bifidobacterium sp. ESL0798]